MAGKFLGALGGLWSCCRGRGNPQNGSRRKRSLRQNCESCWEVRKLAKNLLGEINEFAAATPFEQLEIADAAQQLVAFGVPADQTIDRLKSIGDIAALTGTPIGELSELYGKAQVAGTLYAEDLNQLMGRGIPIVQALASEFGVSESEIKKLASEGQITADHLTAAFEQMTSEGGKFSGGMAQLSETTSGKLSTLTGNAKTAFAEMGLAFLPAVNPILEGVTELVGAFSESFGPAIAETGELVGFAARNMGPIWGIAMENISLAAQNGWERIKTFGLNVVEMGELDGGELGRNSHGHGKRSNDNPLQHWSEPLRLSRRSEVLACRGWVQLRIYRIARWV